MSDWLEALRAIVARGEAGVLVTVARTRGSTPREAGAKMVVTVGAIAGSVGGGSLELEAVTGARDLLARRAAQGLAPHRAEYPLGPRLGQCCGGNASLLFDPVDVARDPEGDPRLWVEALARAREAERPCVLVTLVEAARGRAGGKLVVSADEVHGDLADAGVHTRAVACARAMLATPPAGGNLPAVEVLDEPGPPTTLLLDPIRPEGARLVLFGAGHVGKAVVHVLAGAPVRITWVDSRREEFPEALPPNTRAEVSDRPEYRVDAAPEGASFLVMTHSHPLDLRLVERVLRRDDFAYLGLIGSAAKRRRFEGELRRRGVPPERLARLVCPIGIAGIAGKQPGVIAVAVAAELLRVWEARAAASPPSPVAERACR